MTKTHLNLSRSLIFGMLILAVMSAYSLALGAGSSSPAFVSTGNLNALAGSLYHMGVRAYIVLAATAAPDPAGVDPDYITDEDNPKTVNAPGFLGNDTIVGSPIVSENTIGTVGQVTGVGDDGSFTYNPNGQFEYLAQGASTTDSFSYTVTDDEGASTEVSVTITINGVNDGPSVVANSFTVNEGGTATTLDGGGTDLLANDTDPDTGDDLTLTTTPVSGPTNGDLTLNENGNFSYTHDGSETSSDSFVYEACDTSDACSTATVSIAINAINEAPTAVSDSITVDEGGTATTMSGGGNNLLTNDTDPEGDDLTLTITPVSGPSNGDLTLNSNGTFSYTHDDSETTSDSFVYEACDTGAECSTATVSITINAVNEPPNAVADSITVDEGGTATTLNGGGNNLLTNDTDPDTGDDLTLATTPVSGPTNGDLTLNSDGTFSYTHDGSETTSDSFVYEACDTGAECATATVSITVTPANDAPTDITLSNDTIAEELPELTEVGVFSTTDPDSADTHIYTLVDGTGDTDNASFSISGDKLLTKAPLDYETQSSYKIRVQTSDGIEVYEKAFTITVTNANDPPEAFPDQYDVNTGTTLTVAAPGVLEDDTDPDGDPLTAVLDSGPSNGTLDFNANGSFTYTPNANFEGEDIFTYHAEDGEGGSSAVVEVIINVLDASSPTVKWIKPVGDEGQMDVVDGTVLLEVEAFDDVAVDYVRFYRWDPYILPSGEFVDIEIDEDPPFEVELSVLILNYEFNQIFARAYDNKGHESGRKWIWLYRVPPTHFIFLPLAGGE